MTSPEIDLNQLATDIERQAELRYWRKHTKDIHLTNDEIKAVIAALRTQSAPQWQPIGTAPKDGTLFLMWLPGDDEIGYVPTIQVGFCSRYGEICAAGLCTHMDDDIHPTHWMPMPPPPKEPGP